MEVELGVYKKLFLGSLIYCSVVHAPERFWQSWPCAPGSSGSQGVLLDPAGLAMLAAVRRDPASTREAF